MTGLLSIFEAYAYYSFSLAKRFAAIFSLCMRASSSNC
jgi:hypothetical protein